MTIFLLGLVVIIPTIKGGWNEFSDTRILESDNHFEFHLQTKGQSKWYNEYHTWDKDEVKANWHKLKNGFELVVSDPNKENKGPLEHIVKVLIKR